MRVIRFDNKGWRARFDDGFDEENVSRVADAFGYIWADAHPDATILVGYDTRFNGRRFAGIVAGVLASYGLRAVVSDVACPTPALGWNVAQANDVVGAVMLTASGASCEFGGITARAADGGPIADEFYEAAAQIMPPLPVTALGAFEYRDLVTPYVEHLRACVDVNAIANAAPHLVVDPMHGATRGVLADLLRSMGCRVHETHGDFQPDFGGLHPVPTEPWVDVCEQAVLAYGCDAGLALDGDGDRLGLVNEEGRFVTPHRMVPLIMEHLVEDRGERGRIVATFSSSAYIRRQAERLGCEFTIVPMGFSRIYREFVEGDVLLGAEERGGVCLPRHLVERDGLLSALLLVEHMATRGQGVKELVAEFEANVGEMHYIDRSIRLDAASIQAFRNVLPGLNIRKVCNMEPISIQHSDGLLLRFEDDSWVQLRPSRTEPLVRAIAEAPDAALAQRIAEECCQKALQHLPA